MKQFFLLLILFVAFGANAQQVIHDRDAERRNVGNFEAIDVSSAIDLLLSQGNENVVAVSATSPEDKAAIKTVVENGVLKIWYDQRKWYKGSGRKLRAYVSARSLKRVSASGACDVSVSGELKASELAIRLTGASDFKGTVNVVALKVDLSGASDLSIQGKVDNLNIEASGASHFKGFDLSAENCIVQASGASDVKITVNKVLNAQASGATSIDYKGAGMIGDIKTSGASNITKRDN